MNTVTGRIHGQARRKAAVDDRGDGREQDGAQVHARRAAHPRRRPAAAAQGQTPERRGDDAGLGDRHRRHHGPGGRAQGAGEGYRPRARVDGTAVRGTKVRKYESTKVRKYESTKVRIEVRTGGASGRTASYSCWL